VLINGRTLTQGNSGEQDSPRRRGSNSPPERIIVLSRLAIPAQGFCGCQRPANGPLSLRGTGGPFFFVGKLEGDSFPCPLGDPCHASQARKCRDGCDGLSKALLERHLTGADPLATVLRQFAPVATVWLCEAADVSPKEPRISSYHKGLEPVRNNLFDTGRFGHVSPRKMAV
jgi:hypothetical protein